LSEVSGSAGAPGELPEGVRLTEPTDGIRVVTEEVPGVRSVALGMWVRTGSRDEGPAEAGVSHFLEHLLFKGTAERTAAEIAHAVESVGGDMNAFTAQEMTAFYVRVPDEQLDLAIDILAEVVWAAALRADDVDAERNVILEELHMRDDAPDDLVHELFAHAMFPDHPLGREVLGTQQSIEGMTRESIVRFHRRHYRPSAIVVAAAGNLIHDRVVDRLARHGEALEVGPDIDLGRSVEGLAPARRRAVLTKPVEQVHVVMGTRGIPREDPDRYALTVLNQALGGGMSSRLFQEVRERRGLAYAVYSYRVAYVETGAFGVYVGTAPGRAAETIDVVSTELDRVIRDAGVGGDELTAAKGHLKGSMALSLETSNSRMHRLGSSELMLGETLSLDEVTARVEAVTADDVARVVDRVLSSGARTLAVVGPVDEASVPVPG
jgi:predicted Zn-dependent peptidase